MLSCSCMEWDREPGTWAFYKPDDFTPFYNSRRRKRCCSCKELINIHALCLEFARIRSPYTDIEMKIMGEEIIMSSLYMCEQCGEIFLNLEAAGFCLTPTDNMKDCLAEYHKITGFKPPMSSGRRGKG